MLRSSALILLLLVLPALCFAGDGKTVLRSLHVEGASEAKVIWLVQVLNQFEQGKQQTYSRVFQRNEGSPEWAMIGIVPGEVTQVTRYGSDLVLLLSDSAWLIMGHSSGRPLPDGATLLSLAGDQTHLFALGQAAAPATGPATAQASTQATGEASTGPSTRPAAYRKGPPLNLFELVQGSWKHLADLQPGPAISAVSLGLISADPVAALADDEHVELTQFRNANWHSLGAQKIAGHLSRVIGESGHALIYIDNSDAPSQLLVHTNEWLAPVSMATDAPVRALGVAGGEIRFVYAGRDEQVKERLLSPRTLAVESSDTVLSLRTPANIRHIREWIHWSMMIVISLVMLHTYRKRDEYQRVTVDWHKVQLAPLGRRFFAGLIDLTPLLVALLYARANLGIEITEILGSQTALTRYILPGVAAFLLHTTIMEAITGRSFGKMVTHIYVVRLDGKRPGTMALAIRNILRVVDVALLGFTLVLMFYLPLHQRIGDLAVGTLVVIERQEDMIGPDA